MHHGGIKGHGTDTALLLILHELHINKDMENTSCILQTDLSAAFDTINHRILENKLYHYGIRDKELELIRSYLRDRNQFIEVDTYR